MGQSNVIELKPSSGLVLETPQNKLVKSIKILLQMKKIKIIASNEAYLGYDQNQQYLIKTIEPITNPQLINGYLAIYTNNSKKIFQGEMKDSKRYGFGVQFDIQQKPYYQGMFRDNLYHGWGVTTFYQGEFSYGNRQGWGFYHDEKNQIIYEGFWKENLFDGIGVLNVLRSEIDQFLKENYNIDLSRDKERYAGQWSKGVKNGLGKLIKKGQIYVGDFLNNVYDGQGKLFKENKIYKGKFQKGKFIGN